MDAVTLLVAQLAGPAMLAVGVGIFVSGNYYSKVYRQLENETLAVLISGMTALVVGILIVTNHNRYDTFIAGLVTVLGWWSIVKGLLLLVVPAKVDRVGDFLAGKKWFPYIATFYVVLGAYVSYVAYLM